MNEILISICPATSLAALLFEGATITYSLFGYPVEDETDVDDQNLATCDFKHERSEFLHEVYVLFWDEFIPKEHIYVMQKFTGFLFEIACWKVLIINISLIFH